jgi:hypothetical protein
MSALVDMLVPALAVSGASLAGLVLLPRMPPRVRLYIAAAGLAAWLVPWPWIELPLPGAAAVHAWLADSPPASAGATGWLSYLVGALVLAGAAWFVFDCRQFRLSLAAWRAISRPGESLRPLLPLSLQDTRMEIRIVEGTRVAAASGWLVPTIWIGDRFTEDEQRLALLHECWHVRQHDPLWIACIVALARAYWWNPVVAYLAKHALLMLESACDRRCSASFGEDRYVERLATMLMSADNASSALVAAASRSRNQSVRRLKLLGTKVRLRVRDGMIIACLAAASGIVAAVHAAAPPAIQSPAPRATATAAEGALAVLAAALDGGDQELLNIYLGAFTPQEMPLQPFDTD